MPEFVVFQEVVVGKRAYMRGVSAIDPSILPSIAGPALCRLGPPLASPLPWFRRDIDAVVYYVSPSFGDLAWQLPAHEVGMSMAPPHFLSVSHSPSILHVFSSPSCTPSSLSLSLLHFSSLSLFSTPLCSALLYSAVLHFVVVVSCSC
jgi:hypothetical protein